MYEIIIAPSDAAKTDVCLWVRCISIILDKKWWIPTVLLNSSVKEPLKSFSFIYHLFKYATCK